MEQQYPERIIFRSGTRKVLADYFPGETLLDTARRAGVPILTSCEAGDCGTCMVELRRGDVRMENHSALSDEDLRAGWVLACQSVPSGPHCVVHIP